MKLENLQAVVKIAAQIDAAKNIAANAAKSNVSVKDLVNNLLQNASQFGGDTVLRELIGIACAKQIEKFNAQLAELGVESPNE